MARIRSWGTTGLLAALLLALCVLVMRSEQQTTPNAVVTWGLSVVAGFGVPEAFSTFPVPPTPWGIFEPDSSLPLDGTNYHFASRAIRNLAVCHSGGTNHWLAGGLWGTMFPEFIPTNMTSLFPVDSPMVSQPILGLALVGNAAIAAVEENGAFRLYSWYFPSADSSADNVGGRDPVDDLGPVEILTLPLEGEIHLECGIWFCVASNLVETWAWGVNASRECPFGSITPTLIYNQTISRIVVSPYALFIVASDGVYAWGTNNQFRLGTNLLDSVTYFLAYQLEPTLDATILSNLVDMACGPFHCLLLMPNGRFIGFGDNSKQQMTNQVGSVAFLDTLVDFYPFENISAVTAVTSIGVVGFSTFALTNDGLYAWGDNYEKVSALGVASFGYTMAANPLRVSMPAHFTPTRAPNHPWYENGEGVVLFVPCFVAPSDFDNARERARTSPLGYDRTLPQRGVLAWGATTDLDSRLDYPSSVSPGLPIGARFTSSDTLFVTRPYIVDLPDTPEDPILATSGYGTLARVVASNGINNSLYYWGSLYMDQGAGWPAVPFTATTDVLTFGQSMFGSPKRLSTLPEYSGIASSRTMSCGYRLDGSIQLFDCWGAAIQSTSVSPTVISRPFRNSLLSCGYDHCLFLPDTQSSSAEFWTVGDSANQGGLSALCRSTSFANVPDSVSYTTAPFIAAALGNGFTLLASENEIFGCGSSPSYQLNAQTGSPFNTLTSIYQMGSYRVIQMSAGYAHSLILLQRSTGERELYSMGSNEKGQLGRASNSPALSLGMVRFSLRQSSRSISSVAAAVDTSFAIDSAGEVYVWGYNGFSNRFGDMSLFQMDISTVPIYINLAGQFGNPLKVKKIVSSAHSPNIYAITHFNTTVAEPKLPSTSRRIFSFGADPIGMSVLSGTNPVWKTSFQEISTASFAADEYVVIMRNHKLVTLIVTNKRRLYAIASTVDQINLLPLSTDFPNQRLDMPEPTLLKLLPKDVLDLGMTNVAHLILYTDGTMESLHPRGSSPPEAFVTAPFTAKAIQCSEIGCMVSFENHTAYEYDVNLNFGLPPVSIHSNARRVLLTTYPSVVFTEALNGSIYLAIETQGGTEVVEVSGEFVPGSDSIRHFVGGSSAMFLLTETSRTIYSIAMGASSIFPDYVMPDTLALARIDQNDFFTSKSSIDKIFAMRETVFVLLEDGEVYAWGAWPFSPRNFSDSSVWSDITATVQSPVRMTLPDNYALDGIAGSQAVDLATGAPYVFRAWGRNIVVPPPPTPTPITVPPPPTSPTLCTVPPTGDPNWACNVTSGVWRFVGDVALTEGTKMTIKPSSGTIEVEGDLIITSGGGSAVVELDSEDLENLEKGLVMGPLIKVSGCASLLKPIFIEIEEKSVSKLKNETVIVLVESSCAQSPGHALVSTPPPKGCKQYTAQESQTQSGGRHSLSAVMIITRDTCKHWWIITAAVLATTVVVVTAIVLVVMLTPLKTIILPYQVEVTKYKQ